MDDGYWTPFHLAAAAAAVAADDLRASEASASRGWQMADELHLTVRDLKADKELQRLKSLLDLLARVFDWSDSSYEHAVMHIESAVNNLRADLAAEKQNFDEAIAAQDQALTSRHNNSVDWYQQRFNALRTWVNQEVKPLSEETANRYFAIVANGSPAPHEQADWRDTMHGLTLRAEKAERERDAARLRAHRLFDTLGTVHYSFKMGNQPSGQVLAQWLEFLEKAMKEEPNDSGAQG
jgi:tetratricopeptide (TPR) repeat protein